MSAEQISRTKPSEILAKRLKVIFRNGHAIEYTHVTKMETTVRRDTICFLIKGETDGGFGTRQNVVDCHPVEQMLVSIVDWKEKARESNIRKELRGDVSRTGCEVPPLPSKKR